MCPAVFMPCFMYCAALAVLSRLAVLSCPEACWHMSRRQDALQMHCRMSVLQDAQLPLSPSLPASECCASECFRVPCLSSNFPSRSSGVVFSYWRAGSWVDDLAQTLWLRCYIIKHSKEPNLKNPWRKPVAISTKLSGKSGSKWRLSPAKVPTSWQKGLVMELPQENFRSSNRPLMRCAWPPQGPP